MRLSELLHANVVDADGNSAGRVDDVLLVQDGPPLPPFGAALRIEGIVIGRRSFATRLGFRWGSVDGPWLLATLFRRLESGVRYASWTDIASIEQGEVRMRVRADALRAPPE